MVLVLLRLASTSCYVSNVFTFLFVTRSLSAENLSLQSRLEKCENDYQQRLSIANDQVETLQQDLQR